MADAVLDLGQLLWIGFFGTRASSELKAKIAAGRCGSTILFKRNLEVSNGTTDLDTLCELTAELHLAAPDGTPCPIAVDQEGGVVQRIREPATVWPPMRSFDHATEGDEAFAEQVGLAMGSELRALGFDIDFAPVLDIHTNPANPIIGDRAFGVDPDAVARRALAFARGLERAGILACGKHFPGHGDTATDSHLELPRVEHAMDRMDRIELAPFARAAAVGLPMIMTAHVVFPAIEPGVPATLSHAAITGLLRQRLGYRGVIVSDDLDMKAITDPPAAAIAAIMAGCDVLLLCNNEATQDAVEATLVKELERSSAFRARVGESADRVRAMKRTLTSTRPGRNVVGCDAHRALAARLRGTP